MVSRKFMRIVYALASTVKDCQELENVYNEKTGESFSWDEVYEEIDKAVGELGLDSTN